jgi:hypothetical protein
MLRKRFYAVLAALAAVGIACFGAAQLASAATDNPSLTGQRVWCIDANGLPHYLPAPCKQYKGMWYFGNGANLYQGSAPSTSTVTAGASAKHTTVTFNADWLTNAAIKRMALTSAPTVDSSGFLVPSSVITTAGAETITTRPTPRFYFAFTATGLPAYATASRELWGSNVATTTMASESDVQVEGEVHPATGATTRTYVVSIAAGSLDSNPKAAAGTIDAFANSRTFTVDAWTLVVS